MYMFVFMFVCGHVLHECGGQRTILGAVSQVIHLAFGGRISHRPEVHQM